MTEVRKHQRKLRNGKTVTVHKHERDTPGAASQPGRGDVTATADWDTMTCPACGETHVINLGGNLAGHRAAGSYDYCPGSGTTRRQAEHAAADWPGDDGPAWADYGDA